MLMNIYLVGIKGTGMSHLAAFLKKQGNNVSGCDIKEDFFTAPILKGLNIFSFNDPLPSDTDLVIYSSAYENKSIKPLVDAHKRNISIYTYPEFLALLSKQSSTFGISGTHGKTTTASYSSYLLKSANVNCGAIFGSFLLDNSVYYNGNRNLLLEACEYKDHFNLYSLDGLVITNIDYDHPDYFKCLDDVKNSFHKRVISLNQNGIVICHKSVYSLVSSWCVERPDIKIISYSNNRFKIDNDAELLINFDCCEMALNIKDDILASLLISAVIMLRDSNTSFDSYLLFEKVNMLKEYIPSFPGVASRGEVVCKANDITFICDYAHHPTEIKTCIENSRMKYPSSRIIVVFMPHTASRTNALMNEFVSSLSLADCLFIQDVYSSARKDNSNENLSKQLVKKIEKKMFRSLYSTISQVVYLPSDDMAVRVISSFLLSGDICITMGAGDNRKLIKRIVENI